MQLRFVALATAMTVLGSVDIAAQNADLTVLHGVPGLSGPVDVLANGNQLFSFDFGDQEGPLSLAPGAYAIDVQLNGSSILSANVNLAADTDYSAIAHLDANLGSPKRLGEQLFGYDTPRNMASFLLYTMYNR